MDGTKRAPILVSDPDGDTISEVVDDLNSIGQDDLSGFASVPGLLYEVEAQEFAWSSKEVNESHRGLWLVSITLGDADSNGDCCKSTTVAVFMAEVLGLRIAGIGRCA